MLQSSNNLSNFHLYFDINLKNYVKFICQEKKKRKSSNLYALSKRRNSKRRSTQRVLWCECPSLTTDCLPDLSYHSWPSLSTSPVLCPCCSLDTPGLVIPPRSCFFLECSFSQKMQCLNHFLSVSLQGHSLI